MPSLSNGVQSLLLVVQYLVLCMDGTLDDDSDLDIWCAKFYLSRLRKLLVSLGYVLSRIATRYGEHSSPLISHLRLTENRYYILTGIHMKMIGHSRTEMP